MLRKIQTLMLSLFLITGLSAFTKAEGLQQLEQASKTMQGFAGILSTITDKNTATDALPLLKEQGEKLKALQPMMQALKQRVDGLPEAEQKAFAQDANAIMLPLMRTFQTEIQRLSAIPGVMEVIAPELGKM